MQRAKTQTKGPSPFEVLERRCIEGAIVEESRRGEKEKNPFFPPSHSLLLLAFITLDLLNWNFDPIKLCLHLADMGSQPAIPSFTTTDALSLSLSLSKQFISELGRVASCHRRAQNWRGLSSSRIGRRQSPLPYLRAWPELARAARAAAATPPSFPISDR